MDPFDIFPGKVWEEILNRLESYYDKMNLIKTNSRLELLDSFQDKATEWHFSAVFKILLGHLYRRNKKAFMSLKEPWHFEGELKSAVLNCRRVSKGTKETVDSFVADYWEKYCCIAPFAAPVCLSSLEHANKCLTQVEQLKAVKVRSISPFICGGLLYFHCVGTLSFDAGDVSTRLSLEKAAQLVSHPNIGQNLRGIRAVFRYMADDLQETRNFVQMLLQSASNLVSLSIIFFPTGNQSQGIAVEVAETDIFPELRHLKHLEVRESVNNDEAKSTLRHYVDFKQYFEQLTNLEISFSLWKEEYNDGLVQFPKLKSLLLNKIPLAGSEKNILEIIEKFKLSPAFQCFTFISKEFNRAQRMQDYACFMNCMFFEVRQALNPGESQDWSMTWSEFKYFDESTACVFEFLKRL